MNHPTQHHPTEEAATMTPSTPGSTGRTTRRKGLLAVGTLLVGVALSGCEAPTPTITWYGNGQSTNVGPSLYCEITADAPTCSVTDGPIARLSLSPGDPVQVNIPSEIAAKPWVLVWSYADGESSERSPVSVDGHTLSYVIRPEAGRQLATVELQVPIIVTLQNAPEYPPLQVWSLQVDPDN